MFVVVNLFELSAVSKIYITFTINLMKMKDWLEYLLLQILQIKL